MKERLIELEKKCLACDKCPIGRKYIDGNLSNVFSNMNVGKEIVVVGQNPGKEEIIKRTPFVGISGRIFDDCMKEYAGISRDDLYVCNCVSCFTPDNRKPTELEFTNCSEFLSEQLEIIKPKLVVTLGGVALRVMTGLNGITKYHAKPLFSNKYKVTVFPLLHPSPLNTNRPEKKAEFCDGIKKLREYIDSLNPMI